MVMIVLNLIHILAGVFWAGAILFLALFVGPAVNAAGPAGGAFMHKLMTETRFSMAIAAGGVLTVLTGLVLYWLVSNALSSNWILTGHGLAITLGGIAGILAAVVGATVSKRANLRIGALAAEIQAGGKPPSSAQQSELQNLKNTMRMGSTLSALLVLIALTGMALARSL